MKTKSINNSASFFVFNSEVLAEVCFLFAPSVSPFLFSAAQWKPAGWIVAPPGASPLRDCLCWCLFSSSVQKPYDCVGVKFAVYSYGTVREALRYLQLPCRRGMCSLIGAPLNCDHNVMFVCFRQNVLPQASCWRRRPAVASWMFFLLLFVSIMSRRLWIFIFVCLSCFSVFTSFSFGRRGWVVLVSWSLQQVKILWLQRVLFFLTSTTVAV